MNSLAGGLRSRFWVMVALLGGVVFLNWRPLLSLYRLTHADQEYSHILLVLPIVLASLVFDQRTRDLAGASHRILGVVLLAVSVVVWLVGRSLAAAGDIDLSLQVAALVLAVWAAVLLTFGWNVFRAALFPMLFLLLLIPWPRAVVAQLTLALQSGSATAAYWLFKTFGVPVTRSGFVLSLPSMDIEVAKECSGIRSTVMLFVTTLVLGHWFLGSAWRKTILALAVFPIGIFRNGFRIFVLSVLGSYVNEGWLEGNLHHRGGSAFFVLGLVLIVVLLWLLRRGDSRVADAGLIGPEFPRAMESSKI